MLVVSDVEFFADQLDTYHKQHKMALKIKEKRPIGMLLVDATKMKGLLTPSPLRCLDVSIAILWIGLDVTLWYRLWTVLDVSLDYGLYWM